VRASLLGMLGVVTSLMATVAEQFIPWDIPGQIGADAVDGILNIIASSMLAVTTFSLSVMVAAYASATNNVTPRATKLLMQDPTTQNVLATFIGSFLFSLVGLVALSTGSYGDRGRVVLFVVTVGVIAVIVVTILHWIDHLSRLGRVGETIIRVERAVTKSLQARVEDPFLRARPLLNPKQEIPAGACAIYPEQIGYVQFIDIESLAKWGEETNTEIFVEAVPGTFVHPARALAWVAGPESEEGLKKVRDAFTISDERTYDQDPRFGLSVLAEIASRAMSTAINDGGTAIDVIGRSVRLLAIWRESPAAKELEEFRFPQVWVPPLKVEDMFDDLYLPIARDGAGILEVQIRLQKALLALAQMGDNHFKSSAARHSRLAFKRAEQVLLLEEEKSLLRELSLQVTALDPTISV